MRTIENEERQRHIKWFRLSTKATKQLETNLRIIEVQIREAIPITDYRIATSLTLRQQLKSFQRQIAKRQ
jgi:hypothetical protein